ncbi:T-complex protein 11 [Fasciolopsis buskii]|uniref:T-complex protein 11 n=1 Tax=Fasciolopsis buskii TaxID=27845 RepID=A0A8E0VGG8_9TREM|nr:T-complex protein 11 [Fasciolopsis buski]
MGQLADAANAFYNMSLAHEIAVDSGFKIEKHEPPRESFENCIKKTMHQAFWDILRSSLESDPVDYEPILRLLADVKQSLSDLVLPNQKTLQKLLDNSLDLEVARTELEETGRICLEAYVDPVINLMKQFCAPIRDKEVEALRSIDNPVDAFQHAFRLLEKMHMDLANFTIAQMRPYIRQQAVTYERSKFAEFLEVQQAVGVDGLLCTRNWIREAYEQLNPNEPMGGSQNPSDIHSGSSSASKGADEMIGVSNPTPIPPTPNNILREAYLNLLTRSTTNDWPETVIMDQQRIHDLGTQFSRIVKLSSLVLVACNYVAMNAARIFPDSASVRLNSNIMPDLKKSLCHSAVIALTNGQTDTSESDSDAPDQIVVAVEHWANRVLKNGNESFPTFILPMAIVEGLRAQISDVLNERHPVHALMHRRAVGFLRLALSSQPPESIPLPPGFGVLSDFTQQSLARARALNTGPSIMATGVSNQLQPSGRLLSDSGDTASDCRSETGESSSSLVDAENFSLSDLASRLLSLLTLNRHVFGPWYAEIIQSLLVPKRTSAAPDANNLDSTGSSEHNSANDDTTFHMTT